MSKAKAAPKKKAAIRAPEKKSKPKPRAAAKAAAPAPIIGPFPVNVGPKTVTVVIDGKPHTVAKSLMLAQALSAGDWEQVARLASMARHVAAQALSFGDARVSDDGRVFYRGREISNGSARRIAQLIREGFPVTSEMRCLANLMTHDDPRVIENFEAWIDQWRIPRLDDGRIVLVKRAVPEVRADGVEVYRASHNKSYVYEVGKPATLTWDEVDRTETTCSRGLHFVPLAALKHFSGYGAAILEAYVWPSEIAALPSDYLSVGKVRVREAFISRRLPDDVQEENLSGF